MTDDERTRLLHASTRHMDDLVAHLSTARDIMAMVLRVMPVGLEMLESTRGDLDTLRGLLGRLVQDMPTTDVDQGKDKP